MNFNNNVWYLIFNFILRMTLYFGFIVSIVQKEVEMAIGFGVFIIVEKLEKLK